MTTEANRPVVVTAAHIANALSAWTGIPADRLQVGRGDPAVLKDLRQRLAEHVLGQDSAISSAVAGLERRYLLPERPGHKRPVWTAVFAGRSGVGKTELARCLAELFFGHQHALIRIDCSELTEEHHAARLVGSPLGYIGHGQPGQLVAGLELSGYGTILLDEVEKAHPQILTSIILPLIGDGEVHDMGSGRALDASNTVVIMTTNLGVSYGSEAAVGFSSSRLTKPACRSARFEVLSKPTSLARSWAASMTSSFSLASPARPCNGSGNGRCLRLRAGWQPVVKRCGFVSNRTQEKCCSIASRSHNALREPALFCGYLTRR